MNVDVSAKQTLDAVAAEHEKSRVASPSTSLMQALKQRQDSSTSTQKPLTGATVSARNGTSIEDLDSAAETCGQGRTSEEASRRRDTQKR